MNLIEEGEALLLHQFSQSVKLRSFLRCSIAPFQEIDALLASIHHGQWIQNASGAQLDVLGDLVGQKRGGMEDDDFRVWIKTCVAINRSNGQAEEIIKILRLILGPDFPFWIEEYPEFVFTVVLLEPPLLVQKTLASVVQTLRPVGVRANLVAPSKAPLFRFDCDQGFLGHLAEYV